MKDFAVKAAERAKAAGAQYADVRVIDRRFESLRLKNDAIEEIVAGDDLGWGVRVLVDGGWGFAASFRLDSTTLDRIVAQAVEIARASGQVQRAPVVLGPAPVVRDTVATPIQRDPFQVGVEEKLGVLERTVRGLRVPGVQTAVAWMQLAREHKIFANSEGTLIDQTIYDSCCSSFAMASRGGETQRRSYPNSVNGHAVHAGWEFIEEMDMPGHAPRVGEETVRMLSARPCPSTTTTIIIDGSHLALQLHESAGHALELDRVLGWEVSLAGSSFLTADKVGHFRYGSPAVSITSDPGYPGGRGGYFYDDEGVPARRVPLVQEGILVDYLSGRDTAPFIGKETTGAMKAESWNRVPIVRMTNVNLEPGEWTLPDLIADTEQGLYLETSKTWSIDDRRLNFQFGTELAREIKGGKLGDYVKNATYADITPRFWASCDAVCNRDHWRVWGFTCGKGDPHQMVPVGHGTSPARFRNVRIGGAR